jgi:hypothetical protein
VCPFELDRLLPSYNVVEDVRRLVAERVRDASPVAIGIVAVGRRLAIRVNHGRGIGDASVGAGPRIGSIAGTLHTMNGAGCCTSEASKAEGEELRRIGFTSSGPRPSARSSACFSSTSIAKILSRHEGVERGVEQQGSSGELTTFCRTQLTGLANLTNWPSHRLQASHEKSSSYETRPIPSSGRLWDWPIPRPSHEPGPARDPFSLPRECRRRAPP